MRAVARIQKIIQVTNPTAMIDSEPPTISCCSNRSSPMVYAITVPIATQISSAAATPPHTHLSAERWSDFTRKAMRMLTTSAASRPSRRPISALLNSTASSRVGMPNLAEHR